MEEFDYIIVGAGTALKQAKISQLSLNLGFYERLIQLSIRPRDVYKFWRRPRALQAYWS